MKASVAVSLAAALFFLPLAGREAMSQQMDPNPTSTACGAAPANFVVTHDKAALAAQTVPAGKALVYVIEMMPDYPFVTKKVNIGLDGTWLGATDAQSHMSFMIDPGVHHLCAVYQGHAASMDEQGHTLLLHLDAEAGKIYYIQYHAFFAKDTPGIAFFAPVDEDEGLLLLQRTEHATSVLKK